MTDEGLVAKRAAFVETCVAELRRLARPELLESDVRERRFVEHTLQLAIQACLDITSHVVSEDRLGEARSNHELFTLIAAAGWLDAALAERLRAAAGFRNVLVHGYAEVDLAVVRRALSEGLDDLSAFVAAIRARLG